MENPAKVYVGQCTERIVNCSSGPVTIQRVSFSVKDLDVLRSYMNERGYVNLDLWPKKVKEIGKPSHTMNIDTWKKPSPKPNPSPAENPRIQSPKPEDFNMEDIPF